MQAAAAHPHCLQAHGVYLISRAKHTLVPASPTIPLPGPPPGPPLARCEHPLWGKPSLRGGDDEPGASGLGVRI